MVTHKRGERLELSLLWETVAKLAETATKTLYKPPHVLELEYGACRIAFFYELDAEGNKNGIKKRYISWKFEDPDIDAGKLSASGVEIKRRGSMAFVRDTYADIVDKTFCHCVQDGKVVAQNRQEMQQAALDVLRKQIEALEKKTLGKEKFEYTRGLTTDPSEYKNQAVPHVQAALQEIEATKKGILPFATEAGQRIKFVPCYKRQDMFDLRKAKNHKKRKASECAVSSRLFDPDKHILDRMKAMQDLTNPICQLMQPLGIDPTCMIETTAKKVRAEDSKSGFIFGQTFSGTDVPLEKCLCKPSPPRKKPQQTTMDNRKIRLKKRKPWMSTAKKAKKVRIPEKKPDIRTFFT